MEILHLVLIFVVTISLAITYENIIPLTVTGTRKVRVYCVSDDSNGPSRMLGLFGIIDFSGCIIIKMFTVLQIQTCQ